MGEQDGSTSLRPGTVLAGTPHLVRREPGRGGVGIGDETHRLDTGERRAVKVLSRHLVRDPALEERLWHEAEVLSVLRSPHIVGVRGGGRLATGEAFYEMDLLEGETLRATLGRGPLEPPFACGLVDQALGALHVVHLAGLVHRDVKPDNLFLCADGRCVRLDFGAVTILTEAGRFSPRRFPTDKGGTFGTVRYVPPEAGWRRKAAPAAAPAIAPSAAPAPPGVASPAAPAPPGVASPAAPAPPGVASPAAPVRPRWARRAPLASAITLGVAGVAAGTALSLAVSSWAGPPCAVRPMIPLACASPWRSSSAMGPRDEAA